jgi:hypothetical protein
MTPLRIVWIPLFSMRCWRTWSGNSALHRGAGDAARPSAPHRVHRHWSGSGSIAGAVSAHRRRSGDLARASNLPGQPRTRSPARGGTNGPGEGSRGRGTGSAGAGTEERGVSIGAFATAAALARYHSGEVHGSFFGWSDTIRRITTRFADPGSAARRT